MRIDGMLAPDTAAQFRASPPNPEHNPSSTPAAVRLYQAYQPLLLSGRGFGPVFDGAIFDLLLVSPPSSKGNRILVEGLRTIEQLKDQPEKALLEIIAKQREQLTAPQHRLETLITFVEQRFSHSDAMPFTTADLDLLEDDYFRLTGEEQRELTNESKEIYSNYLAWVKMRREEVLKALTPASSQAEKKGRVKGREIKVIDVGVLVKDGFPKGQGELDQIKEFMLAGKAANGPLQMADNLTTVHKAQRKDLTLGSMLEQVRNKDDLRVLATNGQISVYALRVPHPEHADILDIYGIPNAYLNIVIAVGPHCAPVVLQDSSLNEGYAHNEPPPNKYERGHFHNYFEELDKGRSEYNYQYAHKYPSRNEGIFSFYQIGKTDFFTPGKYIFISNEGKIVMSEKTDSIRMSDERLPSGENVFFMYAPEACFVKFDIRRGFIKIKESEGCDQYCSLGNLGLFVRRGQESGDPEQLILIEQTGKTSQFPLAADLSYSYSGGREKPQNPDVSVFELGLHDYRTEMEKYTPRTVVIVNDHGHLLPGYASFRDGIGALTDTSTFDPRTQVLTIKSTGHFGYYSGERIIRAKYVPAKDGGIGWWMREEPQIFDEPKVGFDNYRLGEVIFHRLAKEPIVREALHLPALSGTIHPDQLNDVISRELSDKLYLILVGQFGAVDDVEQLYDQVKPVLTQVINKCKDEILERREKHLETPFETLEAENRFRLLENMLQGLPQKVKPFTGT